MKNCYFIMLFFIILLSSQKALAQLKADLAAKKDNTLYEDAAGTLSNGAGEYFFVGKTNQTQNQIRRGLIAFDLAGKIPANAVIDSVKLRLVMAQQTIAGPQPVQLLRLVADWGEGTSNASGNEGGGATSTTNDATWIHRFFNTSLWASPGGSFATTVSASQTVAGDGIYFWGSTPQMVADVQFWLATPANNFGWLLRGNETTFPTAKRFATRENVTPANRPVLTVFYRLGTRVENNAGATPAAFHLAQNYPNPFSANGTFGHPSTTILFALPVAANVILQILDLAGRELETLTAGNFSAGTHRVQWNAEKHPGGVYFYRLRAGNFSTTRKLILVR